MKKYYVIATSNCTTRTESLSSTEKIIITVTDNPKGQRPLWQIEAENYNDALKLVSFKMNLNGETKTLSATDF